MLTPLPPQTTAAPGVIGDLREYGGNMLRCFCCVMVAGPLCLIGSAAMFKSSLTDTRGALLDAYKASATDWGRTHAKSWDAAAFDFKASKCGAGGCSLSSTFTRFAGVKTAANEDVHDTPQSGESWSVPANVQKFEPTPQSWAAFASGITAADLAANKFAFSVVDGADKVVASLANVPLTRTSSATLDWRPSSSTSSSSSVDCRWRQAPSGTYSGSRWGDKVYCSSYCASRYGGALSVAGSGRSAVVRCATTFGVAAIELRVKKDPDANVATAAYAFAADAGPNPALGVSMACAQPGAALQTELCAGAVYTSNGAWLAQQTTLGDDGWFGVRYRSGGITAAAGAPWLTAIAFSVRHEADPYVAASKLTGGCSSCTDNPQRASAPTCSARCFGLTADEKKQIALALLVLGLLLCIPPYLIVRYVRQRKGQHGNGGGGSGGSGGAPRAGYPGAGVMPVQQMAPMMVQQGVPMYAQPGQQQPQQQMMMYPAAQQQQPQQQVMVNQYGQPVQVQQMMQPQQQVMVNQYGQPMQQQQQQQQQQQPVLYAQQPGQASY
jgi:hypothetical protein